MGSSCRVHSSDHCQHTHAQQEAQLWKTREARNAFRLRNLEHQRRWVLRPGLPVTDDSIPLTNAPLAHRTDSQMPTWTETGLKTAKLPAPLWEKLRGFYQANKGKAVEDRLDPNEVSGNGGCAVCECIDRYVDPPTNKLPWNSNTPRLSPQISINTWAAPTFRLDLPKELADEVVQTMKSLLEEWTGACVGA